jgi:hypothetical protein
VGVAQFVEHSCGLRLGLTRAKSKPTNITETHDPSETWKTNIRVTIQFRKPQFPFPHPQKPLLMAKELPEDLVTEILLWLPVVSLLRCKCVCKSWYALITHQNFVAKHILHNKKNSNTLLLVQRRDEITEIDLVSTLSYETLQVLRSQPLPPPSLFLGSCNGLVCLRDDSALRVVLWNPATKETKVVPKSNLPHFAPAGHKLGIDGIGFGFDAKTNDYKIVTVAPQILIVLFLIYLFDNIIQLISLRSLWYYGVW